jgi:hypothetical protein
VARLGAGGVTIATVAAWMDNAVQRSLPWGKYLEIMDNNKFILSFININISYIHIYERQYSGSKI